MSWDQLKKRAHLLFSPNHRAIFFRLIHHITVIAFQPPALSFPATRYLMRRMNEASWIVIYPNEIGANLGDMGSAGRSEECEGVPHSVLLIAPIAKYQNLAGAMIKVKFS